MGSLINKFDDQRVKVVYGSINDEIISGGFFLNQGDSFDNFIHSLLK